MLAANIYFIVGDGSIDFPGITNRRNFCMIKHTKTKMLLTIVEKCVGKVVSVQTCTGDGAYCAISYDTIATLQLVRRKPGNLQFKFSSTVVFLFKPCPIIGGAGNKKTFLSFKTAVGL